MKSAYELAMERLDKSAPTKKLTAAQKKKIADVSDKYQSKIAEREIFLKDQITEARRQGEMEAVEQLEKQLVSERKVLNEELEEKKEAIRNKG